MKKVFLFFIAVLFVSFTYAQGFGAKAGFNSTSVKATYGGVSDSESISGFYVGLFTEFDLSDALTLQPEVQFVNVSKDGESSQFINVPFAFKYNVSEGFNVQVGPQISLLLDEKIEDFSNFGFDIFAGLGYDLSENFFIDGRYSLNINNRYTGTGSEDLKVKYNAIQFGIGYRF